MRPLPEPEGSFLHALPLEVAIAFLHVPAHMWKYAYRLLRTHPEAVKAAA